MLGNMSLSAVGSVLKTDLESLKRAGVGAIVTYLGAEALLKGKTPREAHDLIDDIATAKIGRPINEIAEQDGSSFLGYGVAAFLRLGNRIADVFLPLGDTPDAEMSESQATKAKIGLTAVVVASQLIDFKQLMEVVR